MFVQCAAERLSSLLKGFCHLRVLPAAHVATLLGLVAGTVRAFFKGNGTNVVKIAPETAIKLTLNDALKRVRVVLAAAAWGSWHVWRQGGVIVWDQWCV